MNMEQVTSTSNLHLPMSGVSAITMSSREISELVESRHDKVKQSIDRLVSRGVIAQPPMGDVQEIGGNNRVYTTQEYHVNKRDSFVVVAQLSPEFTARLVDRWQQLEEEKATGTAATLTGPQLMAAALIEADATMKAQAQQIEEMQGTVQAHDRLTAADGSLCITDAAKTLGIRPKDLFAWLSANGWTYRRTGNEEWTAYQKVQTSGLLVHRVTTTLQADGSEKVRTQARVTPKGLSVLAKLIQPTAKLIGGAA